MKFTVQYQKPDDWKTSVVIREGGGVLGTVTYDASRRNFDISFAVLFVTAEMRRAAYDIAEALATAYHIDYQCVRALGRLEQVKKVLEPPAEDSGVPEPAAGGKPAMYSILY